MFDDNFSLQEKPCEPFFSWPGSKQATIGKIMKHFPPAANYYEPFLGGGTVFFNVGHKYKNHFLSDFNSGIIAAFLAAQSRTKELKKMLSVFRAIDDKNFYFRIKNDYNRYLKTKDRLIMSQGARFLYLISRTFGSFYRTNSKGEFSGSYASVGRGSCYQPQKIDNAARFLKGCSIKFLSFENVKPKNDSVIYMDPPYCDGKVNYLEGNESKNFQIKVADKFKEWAKENKVLLSNNDTPLVRELYKNFKIEKVMAARYSNHKSKDQLGKNYFNEVLIKSF